jgi:ABC-type amino acid transport/signal transduction systems, periplasmic component/domain
MKKRTLLASLALTAILAACGKSEPVATSAAPAAAPAPAAVTKIVVGLDDNFPPMGFRDEKNELVGFDIDMAREATKRLGMEVEFKPIDWSAKEAELNGKRIDVLWNGLTILESRKQHIAFTDPYMANRQIIIVKAGSDIRTRPVWLARCGRAGIVVCRGCHEEGRRSLQDLQGIQAVR